MARSIPTIQAEMAAARAARAELAGLSSPSATSIYRLFEFVVAGSIWAFEMILDRFRAEVATIISNAPAGTPMWYAARALEFQLDDELVILPSGKPGYGDGGTGARIVTRATAKEASTGKLFIKVAKDGPAPGTLAPLDELTELVQVRGYFDRLRFAGVRLEVRSREADRLRVTGTIYYDPLLPVAMMRANVISAITRYLGALEFDGLVYVTRLTDAIQAVAGVRDVAPLTVEARVGGFLKSIPRAYETEAGYIVPEEMVNYTLLDTLTFAPDGQQ